MPEYVYALHDFTPEHEDELSFSAGERIEVIEKDDLYSDGWWQGRSLSGKIGLFPQTYTTPSQPGFIEARSLSSAVTPMQKLDEEAEHEATTASANAGTQENGQHVMAATLTDVQEAIEQLGGKPAEDQGSISFASSQGGETDKELNTDTENDEDGEGMDPEEWHRGARKLLAQNAAREMEKRRSAESSKQPPIPVELSDESEPEEDADEYHHNTGRFNIGHRKQGSLDTMVAVSSTTGSNGKTPTVLEEEEEPSNDDAPLANGGLKAGARPASTNSAISLPTPTSPQTALPAVNSGMIPDDGPPTATLRPPTQPQTPVPSAPAPTKAISEDVASSLPSPAPSSGGPGVASRPQAGLNILHPPLSPYTPDGHSFGTVTIVNRSASSDSYPPEASPSKPAEAHAPPPSTVRSTNSSAPESAPRSAMSKTHPSEWSVEQVVEWLRSKGFDEGVCEKFIEHEISGDILIELDASSLKELDITAFGKRKKIENAIVELRRPPSINSSNDSGNKNMVSLNSPGAQHASFTSYSTPRDSTIMSPESPPHTGDLAGTPLSERHPGSGGHPPSSLRLQSDPVPWERQTDEMVGLGISTSTSAATSMVNVLDKKKSPKTKPAQLTLNSSTSDGALRKNGKSSPPVNAMQKSPESGYRVDDDEDRVVMSETEAPSNTTTSRSSRRRIWGRSVDSTGSVGSRTRDSKDVSAATTATSLPGSPFVNVSKRASADDKDKIADLPKARPREGKSSSFGGGTERLSFFSGSLGKSKKEARKAPPRYSASSANSDEAEKSGIGRLLSSSSRKSSGRPSTAGGEVNRDSSQGGMRDGAAVLRKRSMNGVSADLRNEPSFGNLRGEPGRAGSILEQIGKPDHSGWMRKKGERYNTWKLRYLVLKGPHLYYLASDSKQETKIKGYINIQGYKVLADENVNPGRYGFRIIHDVEKPHFFSSEDQFAVREWMKSLMKSTIGRDYTKPVVSSCNIPTIPLTVAQAMNPAPRPPSPTARDATQKALRRENPHQLSSRDAQVLMGLPSSSSPGTEEFLPERADVNSLYSNLGIADKMPTSPAPPRPARETRASKLMRSTSTKTNDSGGGGTSPMALQSESTLISWANNHLPSQLHLRETSSGISTGFGLSLLRLGESIRGYPCEPPVPDSAFPTQRGEERLDGLFRLFDLMLDEGVKMGMISINEVRSGNPDKIIQLLRAMKAWEDDRRVVRGQSNGTPWSDGYGTY